MISAVRLDIVKRFFTVDVKVFGLCVSMALFSNFDLCPEILTTFGKNVPKIGLILNLAPKLKNRFLLRELSYIHFKP